MTPIPIPSHPRSAVSNSCSAPSVHPLVGKVYEPIRHIFTFAHRFHIEVSHMKYKNKIRLFIGGFGMLILIFDGRTALYGMNEGVKLCLYTLIPSLFPFIVLSSLICEATIGTRVSLLRPIAKGFGIPEGAESLLVVGLLGGYPIGAQAVADAYRKGQLNQSEAEKLTVICNNPGPAFLFGVLGSMVSNQKYLWLLWGIQIISALLISLIIPGRSRPVASIRNDNVTPLPVLLGKASKSMLNICSCVVFFRMVLQFLQRWILWAIPDIWIAVISGMLELSNGCLLLATVADQNLRLVLASGLLCFGGICVWMQTGAVCQEIKIGQYLFLKSLQSLLCASTTSFIVLPHHKTAYLLPSALIIAYFLLSRKEKDIAIGRLLLYNNKNARQRGNQTCYSEKRSKSAAAIAASEQNLITDRFFAQRKAP